jgi:hypothetical protein
MRRTFACFRKTALLAAIIGLKFALISDALALETPPASALVTDSAPCDTLNIHWKDVFHSDLKVAWDLTDFDCPSDTSIFVNAVHDVYRLKLQPRRGGLAPSFYKYLTDQIQETVYGGRHPRSARVLADMQPNGTMTIYDGFFGEVPVSASATLVHVARHATHSAIEGEEEPGHVECERRQGVCDEKLHEDFAGSGYNYEFMYYAWVKTASTNHALNKQVASLLIADSVAKDFNKVTSEQVRKWSATK